MSVGTEVRTFREALYKCGEEPSCGGAVPASGRQDHEAFHRLIRRLVEREAQPTPADTDVPIRPWPEPHVEPDVEGVEPEVEGVEDRAEPAPGDDLFDPSGDEPVGHLASDELLGRRRFGG